MSRQQSAMDVLGKVVRPPVQAERAACTAPRCKGTLYFRFDAIGRVIEGCTECEARAERAARDERIRQARRSA